MTVLLAASHWVYWLTIFRRSETGGERSHKRGSKFDPFRTTRSTSARTFDFPSWLTYPFQNTGG
jgi:hypothetical protein